MTLASPLRLLLAAALGSAFLAGCQTTVDSSASGTAASAPAPAQAPAPQAKPAPAPAPQARQATEAKEKEPRSQIDGTPAPNSKFNKVQLGMGMKEVMDLIGPPTDQGAYVTGKAWIPFYFGPDRYRHELLYKGQGRLVFAGDNVGNIGSGHLIRIINNAAERGYR